MSALTAATRKARLLSLPHPLVISTMSPLLKPWAVQLTTAMAALLMAVTVLSGPKTVAMLKRVPVGTCAMLCS